MRIKFKAPDPRAGITAQMDSSRGQFFIDNGSAVKVNEDGVERVGSSGTAITKATTPSSSAPAAKPSEGLKVDALRAALEAKGIEIPEGAKKQDLADLLDGSEEK